MPLAAEDWDLRKAGETNPPTDAMTELLSPDVVVQENAEFPDTDSYRGYEGLLRW